MALLLLLLFSAAASAQDTPSGTIQWGTGTLTPNDGTTHEFKVDGLSLVDLGLSSMEASGEVYNLKDIAERVAVPQVRTDDPLCAMRSTAIFGRDWCRPTTAATKMP